jgi:hypothetical protein
MANIAEGFERGRRKEFHQYVASDAEFISPEQFNTLSNLAIEVGRIIGVYEPP